MAAAMAACLSPASSHSLTRVSSHRQQQGALAAVPAKSASPPVPPASTPPSRRLTVRTHASQSSVAAGLAQYHLAQRRGGAAADWFQAAVRDIVKQADGQAPFLQAVHLPPGGSSPRLQTFGVQEAVVGAPELWQGIAEHVGQSSPDVVILVQRVSPNAAAGSPQGAIDAAAAAQQQQQQPSVGALPGSPPASPRSPRSSLEMRAHAQEVCERLVSSGLADAILQGQVGDCCDGGPGHSHSHSNGGEHQLVRSQQGAEPAPAGAQRQGGSPARPLPLPSIVPFSASGSGSLARRRDAVRASALRPAGVPGSDPLSCQQQGGCFYGVVVQSRQHTGVEGCYLLKTVRNVSPGTGCCCTHFSLTRISSGDHLEKQFVQSWLL